MLMMLLSKEKHMQAILLVYHVTVGTMKTFCEQMMYFHNVA